MKVCSSCEINKTLDQFGLDSHRKDRMNLYCKECVRTKSKEKYPFEKKRVYDPEKSRKYRANLSKEKKASQARDKRRSFLKQKYGISLERYFELLKSQNDKCAICQRDSKNFDKALAVDHNHITGSVRGLLCSPCNRLLGFLKIDTTKELALNLLNYVERYS